MIKKLSLLALPFILAATFVLAQPGPGPGPGPGPAPSPWVQSGSQVYWGGCVLVGSATGGCEGNGSVNAQSIFVNGVNLSNTYLPLAGGTMSGTIVMGGNSITGANTISAAASTALILNAATGTSGFLAVNGTGYWGWNTGTFFPASDNTVAIGGPSARASNVYSVLGTFSGNVTVGAITSGAWNGTSVGTQYGGLGANNSLSSGVPLFASGVVTVTGTSGTGNFARVTSPSIASPVFTGTASGANTLPLSMLATQAADTILLNGTGSSAAPSAVALPSCSGATSALTYNTTTHAPGCNTIATSTVGPVWSISRNASQSLTGSFARIQFDTKDNDPSSICDIVTNIGRCTPVQTGYYMVSCQAYAQATTGPGVAASLIAASVYKNGTAVKTQYTFAQVGSISSPATMVEVAGVVVQISSNTDYIECYSSSASTGATIGGVALTYMTGAFIHA